MDGWRYVVFHILTIIPARNPKQCVVRILKGKVGKDPKSSVAAKLAGEVKP